MRSLPSITSGRLVHWTSTLSMCLLSLAPVASTQAPTPPGPTGSAPLSLPAAETVVAGSESNDPAIETLWTGGRYRLTPSDVIELRFPYVPEFDQTLTVQPDGYISLRAVGDLRVQGRSLPELRALLVEAYQGTLRDPDVQIVLKEFEKPYFLVAGEVAHPGKFELRGATTLTQGLALAGGYTSAAKHSQVILFRQLTGDLVEAKEVDVKKMYAARDLSEDPLLRPGDTVFVPKSTLAKIAPVMSRALMGIYLNPFSR